MSDKDFVKALKYKIKSIPSISDSQIGIDFEDFESYIILPYRHLGILT